MKERLSRIRGFPTLFRVLDRYRLDAADQFAGAMGLFGFLALIPMLLLAVALAGYVYADPVDQVRVARALTETLPGFQATLDGGVEAFVAGIVERRGTLTTVGLVALLFTALRPVTAATVATTTIFRAPLPQGPGSKLRAVVALVTLGVVALGAVATSALVGVATIPTAIRLVLSVGVTYALDVLLFWTAYTLLSPGSRVRGRALLPGAMLGAAGWTGLKLAGSAYVSNQVEGANALYGAIGGTVAAVLLLYLAARLFLYGAEFAAVRYEQAHGPLPVPTGTATLARVDDPLPDGRQPTDPDRSPAVVASVSTDRHTGGGHTGGGHAGGRRGDDAAAGTGPADVAVRLDGRPDVRKAVGLGLGLAAAAAAARLLRSEDP